MKTGVAPVALLALVVTVAGCGGGKKSAASPPTTNAATTAAATTTATLPSFATSKNCRQLIELAGRVSKALQPVAGNAQASIDNEAKVLQALADGAPSEIRDDFETFAKAFNAYVQAIAKIDIKPGTTPTAAQLAQLTTAAKAFSSAKLTAAEQHLSAWAQKNCGGATTTTG